jgi:thiamine kinase-like enzyme
MINYAKLKSLKYATDLQYMTALIQNYITNGDGPDLPLSIKSCQIDKISPLRFKKYVIEYNVQMENLRTGKQITATIYGQIIPGHPEPEISNQTFNDSSCKIIRDGSNQDRLELHFDIPSLKMSLQTSGHDRKLKSLFKATNPNFMHKIFMSRLPHFSNGKVKLLDLKYRILGHRLERRCTLLYALRYLDKPDGRPRNMNLIGKVYRNDMGIEIFKVMDRLWRADFNKNSKDKLRTPQPVAYIPELGMVLQDEVKGKSLHDSLTDFQLSSEMIDGVAEALAMLHKSSLKIDKIYTVDEEVQLVEDWTNTMEEIDGDKANKFRRILKAIMGLSAEMRDIELRPAHRDFYDKQILFNKSEKRMTILDFDTFCKADPALDVGNFLAHLTLRSLQLFGIKDKFEEMAKTFLERYLSLMPDANIQRIAFYQGTTCFRLACLYLLRPKWNSVVLPLLEESERCLYNNFSKLAHY